MKHPRIKALQYRKDQPTQLATCIRLILIAAIGSSSSVASAQSVWKGDVSEDMRDEANWTSPPGYDDEVIINNIGIFRPTVELNDLDEYYYLSARKIFIGNTPGTNTEVKVSSNITQDPQQSWLTKGTFQLSGDESFAIGSSGANGSLNIDGSKDEGINVYISSYGYNSSTGSYTQSLIGSGSGSTGTLSITGKGFNKYLQIPHNSEIAGTQVQADLTGLLVGESGGTGVINVTNAGFIFRNYSASSSADKIPPITIGTGSGSRGELNILSGGKVNLHAYEGSGNEGGISIGENGGMGVATVSGKNELGYSSKLIAGKGGIIGSGSGSEGRVNVLSGGKFTSYGMHDFNHEITSLDPIIGSDSGKGHVLVSGIESQWLVAGSPHIGYVNIDQNNPEYNPPYFEDDGPYERRGLISVGESGEGILQISDRGEVRLGRIYLAYINEQIGQNSFDYYDMYNFSVGGREVVLGSETSGSGRLVFGSLSWEEAVAPGYLIGASHIRIGDGQGSILFNHTDNDYKFRTPIVGKGTLASYAGTTWLEPISQLPAGVPVDNANFSGTTELHGGAFGLTYDQALGTSQIVAFGDGALIFNDGLTVNNTALITSGGKLSIQVDAGSQAIYAGQMAGDGRFGKTGSGSLILTGNSTAFAGDSQLYSGELWVNGQLGSAGSTLTTVSGTTLGGAGTIGGSVSIGDGGYLLPGKQRGTPSVLTIGENLVLANSSTSRFLFGQPGSIGGDYNDLVNVGGDLTLGGALEVGLAPGGTLMPGVYRIFNYAGSLTNNGFALGTLPPEMGHVQMQTSIAQQVNLILTDPNGRPLLFWDGQNGIASNGKIEGGDGTWQNINGNRFWTDAEGTTNARFADGGFAVFSGTPGTVTVDGSLGPITVDGMQFLSSGYTVTGSEITLLDADAWIRVGDSSVGRPTYLTRNPESTATINSNLVGDARLVKTDAGTLVLNGNNTQAGGTLIQSGIVQIASDTALGKAGTALGFGTGALRTTTDLSLSRDITSAGEATFLTTAGTTLALSSRISGDGGFGKGETGRLIYTGDGSAMGGNVRVSAGELWVNSTLGKAGSLATVESGALLGGAGRMAGSVSIGDGATLFPGSEADIPATFNIDGNLTFAPGATLRALLGQPGVFGGAYNDLVAVGGNLVLDGTVEIGLSSSNDLTPGVYHLITYGGTLDNRGLAIGTLPAELTGSRVQTAIGGQVNLVLPDDDGAVLSFWDGRDGTANDGWITGGSGTWQAAAGNALWTDLDGAVNAPFADASFAIFGGKPGTVTVDDSLGTINVNGMQFLSHGYVINGAGINLVDPESFIRVGDSSIGRPEFLTRVPERVATIDSALAGNGRLIKTDSGTLVLGGNNTYTGGTTIREGVLQIAADTALGNAEGDVAFNSGALRTTADISTSRAVSVKTLGTLLTTDGTTLTLGGTLSGSGMLVKADAGTARITGNASGFAGKTEVAQGILDINSTLGGSSVEVRNGGTLIGTGKVATGQTTIHSGGVIAPGNSIGQLTLTQNYQQLSGGIYRVEVDPASTQADHIQIDAKATIDPGAILDVVRTKRDPYQLHTRYTVLTANEGLAGTFALTGDIQASAFLSLKDSYDANHAYLGVVQTRSLADADCSPNAKAAGEGAEGLADDSGLKTALLNQPDMASACDAMSQISGEAHASAGAALMEDSRFLRNAIGTRSSSLYQDWENEQRDAIWAEAYGSWGRFNHGNEYQRLGRDVAGIFIGSDWQVGSQAQLGLVGGYADSTFKIDQFGDRLESQDLHLAAWAATHWDSGWKIHGGIAHTWHDIEGKRRISIPWFSDVLSSQYDASTQQVFAEVSRRLQKANTAIEPYAAVAWVRLDQDGFTEKGGEAALTAPDADHDSTFGSIGFRLKHLHEQAEGKSIEFTAGVGWRHLFGERTLDRPIGLMAGGDFLVQGAPLARNSLAVDLGIEAKLSDRSRLGLEYAGMHGGGIEDHGAKAYVQWKF